MILIFLSSKSFSDSILFVDFSNLQTETEFCFQCFLVLMCVQRNCFSNFVCIRICSKLERIAVNTTVNLVRQFDSLNTDRTIKRAQLDRRNGKDSNHEQHI